MKLGTRFLVSLRYRRCCQSPAVLDKSNKPTCPPGTQYFETDCEFGCREVPR
ncbi:MAG TPA: hypothetical protein VJS66_09065 [Burkholderiales bacterium]|nr:hypothetical protein [Burkholderiales bacterium]